jgi:hypothetical protein
MKYLDINSFLGINSILDNLDLGESVVSGRVEAYSCTYSSSFLLFLCAGLVNSSSHHAGKTVGSDKKLYKELEYQISMSKSPKGMEVDLSVSPFGPLTEGASKKTFMYLIATLNSSYFDYDFRYHHNFLYTYALFWLVVTQTLVVTHHIAMHNVNALYNDYNSSC